MDVVPCIPSLPSLNLALAEEAEDLEVETLGQQVLPIKAVGAAAEDVKEVKEVVKAKARHY